LHPGLKQFPIMRPLPPVCSRVFKIKARPVEHMVL
jgi:hypothetical protein